MKDSRNKIAVVAVIFGLGGLGGFAMASNPVQQQAPTAALVSHNGQKTPQVSTSTSGASSSLPTSSPTLGTPASQALPRFTALGGGGRDD